MHRSTRQVRRLTFSALLVCGVIGLPGFAISGTPTDLEQTDDRLVKHARRGDAPQRRDDRSPIGVRPLPRTLSEALILQHDPTLSPDTVKARLMVIALWSDTALWSDSVVAGD